MGQMESTADGCFNKTFINLNEENSLKQTLLYHWDQTTSICLGKKVDYPLYKNNPSLILKESYNNENAIIEDCYQPLQYPPSILPIILPKPNEIIGTASFHLFMEECKKNPIGAYLIYLPENDGTWQCIWSKTFVENAWSFFRPARLPDKKSFKRKGEVLAIGINKSIEKLSEGIIKFIKFAKKRNAKLFLVLPAFNNIDELPTLLLTLHQSNEQVVKVIQPGDSTVESLQKFDAIALVTGLNGTVAATNLQQSNKVVLNTFMAMAAEHGYSSVI